MIRHLAWLLIAFSLCVGQTSQLESPHREKFNPILTNHTGNTDSSLLNRATNDSQRREISITTELVKPTKPTVEPTKPTVEPTKPTVEPTKPTVEPTTSTTETPTSTTETPTSTKEPSKPTTKTPSTTEPPKPTTKTPSTTEPPPPNGSWSVLNAKNVTCLRIEGIFVIDYAFNSTVKGHSDVPKDAKANGTCKAKEGIITLSWKYSTDENQLKFIFMKNDKTNNYVLAGFSGQIYVPEFEKIENFTTNNNETHFETPVNQSYSCSSMKQIVVNNHIKVILDEFHLQAFKTSNTTGFDASKDCAGSAEHTPDIVPIIVGCVLALLVIAVLVTYLLSRRRSLTRGYLSM